MSPPRMIKFKCSDGVVLKVDEAVAIRSIWAREMIKDGYGDDVIPLRFINSSIFRQIFGLLECQYYYLENEIANEITLHYLNNTKDEYLSYLGACIRKEEFKSRDAWEVLKYREAEFVNVDNNTLFDLIRAVDYLDIPELLDLTRQNLLDRIGRNISIDDIPWDIDQLLLRNEQWAELNALM